jgi:hypothetical protein
MVVQAAVPGTSGTAAKLLAASIFRWTSESGFLFAEATNQTL